MSTQVDSSSIQVSTSVISSAITSSTSDGQSGTDTLSGSHVQFIIHGHDLVTLTAGSNYDFISMKAGGAVVLNGSHNTVAGEGSLSVTEAPGASYNTFNLGAVVTTFTGKDIQPTDIFNLSGFTQADIVAGFAQLSPQSETLTISHPGSASIAFGFSQQNGQMPTIGQFHAV
jgi:hypothetical protein